MAAGIDRQALLDSLPAQWDESLMPIIRRRVAASGERFIILDDDPTGGQTLHGLPVLAAWDVESLARELEGSATFFLLTNSRALREPEAIGVARDVGRSLRQVQQQTGRLVVGSRGDSTLRGHFPAETDALFAALTGREDARPKYVFVPYFGEGGRITINDTQYVQQGDRLVPVAQTEFALDPRFGYTQSHLPSWLEERSAGRFRARDVVSVTIEDVRLGGPEAVARKLGSVPEGGVAILNATCDRDLEVFVAGLLEVEAGGRQFLYRSAASFVRVRAGIEPQDLLSAAELGTGKKPGLVVAGSYVDRTSRQLASLLAGEAVQGVEFSVEALLGDTGGEAARAAGEVSGALHAGRDAVLYTSRAFLGESGGLDSVEIGRRITEALCEVLARVDEQPGFLIVKGGSTAHGIATRGLGLRRAVVLGQLLAGVPVWRLGAESRYPELPYVVFPGNVGGPDALAEAVRRLHGCEDAGPR
jgi:uncharacterized protein YgbK (DUF1537 family)